MNDVLKSFSTAVEQLELLKKELKSQQSTSRLLSALVGALESISESAERHASDLSESNRKIESVRAVILSWQQQVQLPDFKNLIEDFVRQVTDVQQSLNQLGNRSEAYRLQFDRVNSVLAAQLASMEQISRTISENSDLLSGKFDSILADWREETNRGWIQLAQQLHDAHSASDAKSDELRTALAQIFKQIPDLFRKSSELSASQIIAAVVPKLDAHATKLVAMEQRLGRIEENISRISNSVELMSKKKAFFWQS